MNIKIISDGTRIGTELLIDGKKIENLTDINFAVCYGMPYFSYTIEDIKDEEAGLIVQERHILVDQYKMDTMTNDSYFIGGSELQVSNSSIKVISNIIQVCACDDIHQLLGFSHNSKLSNKEPSWGDVMKQRAKLPNGAFADESGRGYPHHFVVNPTGSDKEGHWTGGTMFLHKAGLNAAWAASQGAHTGKKASARVIAHLAKHRKDIK